MKKYCVVSHTHWDREWYMPFEQFRLRLVKLVDNLLDILQDYPDFIFHLDAQTIVLEDYLEVRPEKKQLLEKYISSGNILVGPWYMQNDFYLTSGEATVRNLLEGTSIANSFGACAKAGYAPDQFGNISQLPQILKNFGIDNFIFGRGYHDYSYEIEGKTRTFEGDLPPFICGDLAGNGIDGAKRVFKPAEFTWRGADGTECIAICMLYWYNNAQRFSEDTEQAKLVLSVNDYLFADYMKTPYMLLMNGVDHLEAQENLLPILQRLNESLPEGATIEQISMEEYVSLVKSYIQENNVEMHIENGELRHGADNEILNGTLSSRHYLKVANNRAQNMLENRLEPLYAIMNRSGITVDGRDHMRYFWRQLLKNHPHDSICGCSRDEVHKHMEDNFERLGEATAFYLKDGITALAHHTWCADMGEEAYSISLVNTTEHTVDGTFEAVLEVIDGDGVENLELIDEEGNSVPFFIKEKRRLPLSVQSPINLPGVKDIIRYTLLIRDSVKAYAVKSYLVKSIDGDVNTATGKADALENEYLRVEIEPSGKVSLTDKRTLKRIDDVLDVEEVGDKGESYIFMMAEPMYHREDMKVTVSDITDEGGLRQSAVIRYDMEVPVGYDFNEWKRCDEKVVCTLELELSLAAGERTLHVNYKLDNKARDHRVRILVQSGADTLLSTADIPFDVVTMRRGEESCVSKSHVHPNSTFAAATDAQGGIAVFTEGAHEYEHLAEKGGYLAFTIVRANGRISGMNTLTESEQWLIPGNQCLRTIEGRLGLMPVKENVLDDEVLRYAKEFRNAPLSISVNNNPRKFLGGRAAVQDSGVREAFIRQDKFASVRVADNTPVFEIAADKGITVTALKQAIDGNGFILRAVNMDMQSSSLKVKGEVTPCLMTEEATAPTAKGESEFKLGAKKIQTVRIG